MVKNYGDGGITMIGFKKMHGVRTENMSTSYNSNEKIPAFDMRIKANEDDLYVYVRDIDDDCHIFNIPKGNEMFVKGTLLIFDSSKIKTEYKDGKIW